MPGAGIEVDPAGLGVGAAAEDAAGGEEVPTAGTAVAGREIIDLEPMEQSAMQQSATDTGLGAGPGAGSTSEGVVTRLDQGSGWVLDVVRPRVRAQGAAGVARVAS